ncbi:2-oxo-4-hydroxy-4-carboxy-5-ureidoimidazoline decarboxylase [candidate division KSB1 bacterium]|nr:2-oxo-4-hydroxy-4-carboxy-5-ureidoimidazoline decarboxylase [candidate division KSB1 bacterium]
MTLAYFNNLAHDAALAELLRCCGARRWAEMMAQRRPFNSEAELFAVGEEIWQSLAPQDWREAFSHHPKIGDLTSLRAKFANTRQWSEGEQAGVTGAAEDILHALADGNEAYHKKFGFIFIVCATGKSAGEMLALLQQRLPNDPKLELKIAAAEQAQITKIRLEKLLAV